MEIFGSYEDFIGQADTKGMNEAFYELMTLIGKVSAEFRRKSDLLNQYLKLLFCGLSAGHIYNLSERGFYENARLRNLVRETLRGEMGSHYAHPLYGTVNAYIRQNPLAVTDENTKISIYMVALARDFLDYIAREQHEAQITLLRQRVDLDCLAALRRELSEVMGEEIIERIETLVRERFQTVTYMNMLLQSTADYLSFTLTSRDVESSRTVLELSLSDKLQPEVQDIAEVRYNG